MAESTTSAYEANAAEVAEPVTMSQGDLRGNYSPLRPGSTLIAYQPNGSNSPKTPGRMGKSQHLAQVRSLGLLHDLQEYISSVESMAAEQKRELERVREEKRDMEKFLARSEAAHQERGGALDFMSSELADLPPRMRALIEDNRGLREVLKKYKSRTQTLEQQVTQQHSQVLALAEANERLKQSLAECSRTPAEVEREDALKKQLELKSRQLENLEHGLSVLRAKLDTDSKLYRQNLAAAAREKDALKRQLVAAKAAMEERDKEMRALNVELRKTRRGAAPTRQSVLTGTYHLPGANAAAATEPGPEGDDAQGSGGAPADDPNGALEPPPPPPPLEEASLQLVAPPLPPPSPPPPAPPEPEERIRIMLIIVRDEVVVHVPVPAAEAAVAEAPAASVEEPPAAAASAVDEPAQPEVERPPEPGPLPAQPEAASDPEPVPGPALDADAAAPDPAPEPAVEVAPEPAPGPELDGGLEPQQEPSVIGMVQLQPEEPDMTAAGAWSTSAGEDSSPGAEVEAEGGGGTGVEGDGGTLPESDPAAAEAGEAAPHSHSSPPLPVPYARTAARALAARVGGSSAVNRHPHPPPHGVGTTTAAAAAGHRKGSNASSTSGAGGKAHTALKGVGATSRK